MLAAGALAAAGCGTTNSSGETNPKTTAAPATTTQASTTQATSAPANSIDASLSEFKISGAPASVAAGKVTLKATDAGKIPHELVVLKTTKPAADLGKAGTSRIPETGHVGEVGEIKPGASGTTTLHLKPGHYVLVCNLPGHWAGGMRADLTVK
jgi:uncharacterized cupredoxin-like copper-binding protein